MLALMSLFPCYFYRNMYCFFLIFRFRNLQRHPSEPAMPHAVTDRRVHDRHPGTLSADDAGAATVPGPGA